MEYTKEMLLNIIASIKTLGARKGNVISDRQIAKTINISDAQLSSYLQGDNKMPDDLVAQLLSVYGIKVKVFESSLEREVHLPDENSGENQE